MRSHDKDPIKMFVLLFLFYVVCRFLQWNFLNLYTQKNPDQTWEPCT